jgi:hypothetical protein
MKKIINDNFISEECNFDIDSELKILFNWLFIC